MGRQVVHAVGQVHDLAVVIVLAHLFDRAVNITDMRLYLGDDLTVQPQHQTQHPVRRGVLRTHVYKILLGLQVAGGVRLLFYQFHQYEIIFTGST